MTPTGRELQRLSLESALAELSGEEVRVLRARYGIGCASVEDEELAASLGLSVLEVWEIESRALETLGFLLLAGAGVFESADAAEAA